MRLERDAVESVRARATLVVGQQIGQPATGRPRDAMQALMNAFARGGGEGKPVVVQHSLSWAATEAEARRAAREQWRFATLDAEKLWSLRMPADFAAATASVSEDDVARVIRVSADLERHQSWLAEYAELGVSRVYCFNVGLNQREFIEAFGARVVPRLAGG